MTAPDLERSLQAVEALMRAACRCGEPRIEAAAAHHLDAGGSRTRARLALSAASALRIDGGAAVSIAAGCELLHNASLVHDDLQDADGTRRGRTSVWRAFDAETAVNLGDLMLSEAYGALGEARIRPGGLVRRAARAVGETIAGQARDLALRGEAATIGIYEAVASGKSGPLLALPFELPLLACGEDAAADQAGRAARAFAVAYQILDDLSDVDADAARGELNAVAVLSTPGVDAKAAALKLARTRLDDARRLATELPFGCGAALIEAADRLAPLAEAHAA